ncbi:MAG: hypothetical protein J5755_06090 [Clostridia bacterium]|nr:hypothetical protein [Clostridia bacterium]
MKKGLVVVMIGVAVGLIAMLGIKVSRAYSTQIMASAQSLVEERVRAEINAVALPMIEECTQKEGIVTISSNPSTSVNVDSYRLSQLVSKTLLAMQRDLELYRSKALTLPRGALTGLTFLADKGRAVDYNVKTDYATYCTYTSSLECVGINRVRYAIYMQLTVDAKIVVPLSSESISVTQYLPICEYVFAGEVPGVYVNSAEGTNYLDLVP